MADDIGKLVLRVMVGVLLLMHGIPKLLGGLGYVHSLLAAHHLPGWLAYFVLVGEVVAPLMILIGYYTRLGGALVAVNMVVAIALAHGHQLFALNRNGVWALELEGFYLFGGLAIALLGGGRYSAKDS